VDSITASRIANMKELRPPSSGRSEIRILLVFDPWRSAVLTQDVLNRFITALGGTLKLIADFGDEQLKIA
jgi:hypothetical protein